MEGQNPDQKQLSAEDVDKHLEQHAGKAQAAAPGNLSAEQQKAFNICTTYNVVAPVLKFLIPLLSLIKPKWADAVRPFIAVMDANCNQPA